MGKLLSILFTIHYCFTCSSRRATLTKTTPLPWGGFFLVNLSPGSYDPAFGAGTDASVTAKIVTLIASVRTLMRSKLKRKYNGFLAGLFRLRGEMVWETQ